MLQKIKPTMLALRQSIITRPISITGALRTSIQRPLTSSIFRATSSFHTKSLLYNTSKSTDQLNWNEFLALRIKRRRVNVISSGITAILGVGAGWAFISNIEIDPTQMIFGFDPLAVYSIGLVICGILGSLVGPSFGDVVFKRFIIPKKLMQFNAKNSQFLKHIVKNRPDPSKQSYANPVTDYYGEKIGSLKDYRRWLRDGRAYRKRSEKFL